MAEENDFSSFDENAWKAQDAADDREIAKLLGDSQNNGGGIILDNAEFDQSGKADDAEDYEDISDDDLPDEEEPSAGVSMEMPGLTDDGGTSHDPDDLFGEGSSPDPILGPSSPAPQIRDADTTDDTQPLDASLSFPGINFDPEPHLDNQDHDIPAPAETVEDLLKATWPAFKKGHILTWSELLPAKKATWKEKKPVKKPKQLVTSKLTLELAPDQEKLFRIPGTATITRKPRQGEERGLVYCGMDQEDQAEDNVQFDLDQESDSETVAGFTLRDIELACEDWGASIEAIEADFKARQAAEQQEQQARKRVFEEQDDEWDAEFLMDLGDEGPPRPKKRKTVKLGLPEIPRYAAPSFDNFEDATRRGAKRVQLDMSDPYLLIETQETQRNAKRPRTDNKLKRMANGNLGRDVSNRFNISNDEAYEALKENHQSKVRATLGNISVEHSMPAIKLSWPYYKVKLGGTTDEYHRPRFRYKKFAGHIIKFDKPAHQKRKQMKGKAHEVFLKSKDLSINDNSTAVLYEYCEQRPRVLSSFGMGNRLINYYRRKDTNEDEQLPKQELGEYRMLLPEDRSPFSLFGTVDPGETVPTLHNEMYRAPVFKHNPRGSDFLVVRSTTGEHGSRWYLHKIDHLYVVGQQFPSVEVPGPHSRKVTNASKNRMKMLAFRMIRHSDTDNCQLSDITKHIADSTDTQNRQKLKEFLQYDRESGEKGMWRLKPGEILPDESTIRSMIKPEEVCLLDAMQLGIKELEDAGYDPRNASLEEDVQNNDADGDDDEAEDEGSKITKGAKKQQEKQEETLADKMAPWKTTKAFIDACAQKAMLQLHGEGDPTGHGLGFSFIRTSMKGGYIEAVQGPLATSADAMEREKRANGGHAYNVKKQQAMYEEGIREIWEKQKSTLSDGQEHDDKDVAVTEDEDDRFNVQSAMTPAQFDDGTSQISGLTSASRQQRRAIRITREIRMPDGSMQDRVEVVHDPVVISQYMKRRTEADLEMRDIYSSRPTGNADHDRLAGIRIKKELERLEKNKARRQAREQQKELHQKASTGDAGSPSVNGDKVPTGTTRKCANCGQVGHIKTNKNRSRKSQLQLAMEQCDKIKARDAKRRAEEKAREDKAIAIQLQKERRAAEKEAERKRKDEEAKRQQEEREAKARQVQEQRAAKAKEQAEQKRVKDELKRRIQERKAYEQEIARAQREAERIRNAWKVPKWRSGGGWR
ncbi:transcription initiation factor TFIID subunit 1 [Fusarium tjaetaba]|uniref:Transcription initiation factor TFIID subunit 1 n=1 Tax=Fusarium tjaetaba TaxID=1567544 RepID=A0A8H5SD49_9HYPO|nr:transcription initiation factor TFIID subunit 1 [Fusarium tjaetaba]KAF5649468.1 transcription initiation factor TFIID subunit 1 [Fusarium tjaetaba]